MSSAASASCACATYRVTDPIENLLLQVSLRKRGTHGERRLEQRDGPLTPRSRSFRKGGARGSVRGRSGRGDDDPPGSDDEAEGDDDDEAAPMRVQREEADELVCPPRTFRWQEKVFSKAEVKAVRRKPPALQRSRSSLSLAVAGLAEMAGSFSLTSSAADAAARPPMSAYHREVLARLDREAAARGDVYQGDVLFSRVNSDRYADPHELNMKLTDSEAETATPLARAVLSGAFAKQHRDMLGEAANAAMHIFAALPADDLSPATPRATSLLSRSRRSLFGGDSDGEREGADRTEEVLLCTLRLYPAGRLDVKPPLSVDPSASPFGAAAAGEEGVGPDGQPLARWYAIPGTRYEYKVENLAEGLGAREYEHEAAAERVAKLSLSAAHAVTRAMPELDFSAPPRKAARVHHFIELQSAHGFGATSLFVVYYALAAPGWRLMSHCVQSAITQTSTVVGVEQRAVLGFPIEVSLESHGAPVHARPPLTLFFSVISRDAHERMTQLGYAQLSPPMTTGCTDEELGAWRLADDRTESLRRFFVGGTQELRDLRAIALPDGLDPSGTHCLNKHGVQTVATGRLRVRVQTMIQQHQLPAATAKAGGGASAAARAATAAGAARKPDLVRRSAPEMGSLKGVLNVSTLARSETAADRVKRRLEERRRADGQ